LIKLYYTRINRIATLILIVLMNKVHVLLLLFKINNYCKVNYARVIEEILVNHDICEGVRSRIEFNCAKKKQVFNFVIWVDASERMPLENPESMELSEDDADLI